MLRECPICHAACGIRGSFHSQGMILETYCNGGHSRPIRYVDIQDRGRGFDAESMKELARIDAQELHRVRVASGRRGGMATSKKIRRVNGRFVKVAT